MNYDSIKALAASRGKRVKDFLALAMQNDPFYVGQPAELEAAKWFAGIWDSGILAGSSHLRGIHYVMVSREDPLLMPDGKPYENTDKCWMFLAAAAKAARYLELVDPRAFKDRRSQAPVIHTPNRSEPFISIGGIEDGYSLDLGLPEFPDLPSYELTDFRGTQKYMTEIWIEKSTMEDTLLPLCEAYGCNLVTGVGELSVTQCIALVDRIIHFQRPCRVLYISDFDPAGRSMPVAVARKVEFYQRNQYPDIDIQIQQVALTYEQCQKYKLPRTPIKETEKRASKFQAIYGEGATELDALEALHPGELARIVKGELERFYDNKLNNRCWTAASRIERSMRERQAIIVSQYADEINELQDKYENIKANFDGQVADLADRVTDIWQAISDEMEREIPETLEVPEAEVDPGKEWTEPLYSSERDYEDQLGHYHKFKNGGHHGQPGI